MTELFLILLSVLVVDLLICVSCYFIGLSVGVFIRYKRNLEEANRWQRELRKIQRPLNLTEIFRQDVSRKEEL